MPSPVRPLGEVVPHVSAAHCDLLELSRVSNGASSFRLDKQTQANLLAAKKAGRNVVDCWEIVERATPNARRDKIKRIFDRAREKGLGVLVRDRTRFLRSESFDPKHNLFAEPTQSEVDDFMWEIAWAVPLFCATDPQFSMRQIHSLVSGQGGGRDLSFSPEKGCEILGLMKRMKAAGRGYRTVAKVAGVTREVVRGLWKKYGASPDPVSAFLAEYPVGGVATRI